MHEQHKKSQQRITPKPALQGIFSVVVLAVLVLCIAAYIVLRLT